MHDLPSLLIQMVQIFVEQNFPADLSDLNVKKKLKFVIGQGELTFEGPKIVKEGQTRNGYEIEYEDGSSEIYDENGLRMSIDAPTTYGEADPDDIKVQYKPKSNPNDPKFIKLQEFESRYDADGLTPTISSRCSLGIFKVIADMFK